MPPVSIPIGLSTRVGLIVSAVLAIVAAATTLFDGDQTPETITALVGAVITLVTVLQGRYAQAAATAAPAPAAETMDEDDELGDANARDLPPYLHDVPDGPVPIHDQGDGQVAP